MKARHCRPRRHRTPRTQSHAAAALSSQLSALSLSLTDTPVPTPDVRRRPTAPPSPPDRRQYEAGRSRAARSPGPAPRALGAALRALATLPRGLGSPPSHMSFTRREDARPGIRRDPHPVLPPSCRPAAALPPQRVGTAAVPYEHPRSTLPRPSLAAGPARELAHATDHSCPRRRPCARTRPAATSRCRPRAPRPRRSRGTVPSRPTSRRPSASATRSPPSCAASASSRAARSRRARSCSRSSRRTPSTTPRCRPSKPTSAR